MRTTFAELIAGLVLATPAQAQGDKAAPVVPAEEAIRNVHLAPLDPSPLDAAEVGRALGDGPRCMFRYTLAGGPVLVVGLNDGRPAEAYLKLNGKLVRLAADDGSSTPAASGASRSPLSPCASRSSRSEARRPSSQRTRP